MIAGVREAKADLRRRVLAIVAGMSEAEREAESAEAVARCAAQASWQAARAVLLYAPLPGELDIWPLAAEAMAAGKRVALPRFDAASGVYGAGWLGDLGSEVARGQFGIREPAAHCAAVALNLLDLILVPGVAFDVQGRRLGRGKGFYDQLLAGLRAVKCGAAFERQLVQEIPVAAHDIHMNCILTPARWVSVRDPEPVLE